MLMTQYKLLVTKKLLVVMLDGIKVFSMPVFFQFYLELSRGPHEISNPEGVVIASARPEILGKSFPTLDQALSRTAQANEITSSGWGKIKEILFGRVDDFIALSPENRFKAYGQTKVNHITKFADRESQTGHCHIFMGDNGQGDHFAGVQLLKEVDENFANVFIHNVTHAPSLEQPHSDDVIIHSTYPDAAWTAYLSGMISHDGLIRVLKSAAESDQYQLCKMCLKTHRCKRNPFTTDGGCTVLFDDLGEVSKKAGFDITIPRHFVFQEIELLGFSPTVILVVFLILVLVASGLLLANHVTRR